MKRWDEERRGEEEEKIYRYIGDFFLFFYLL